MCIYGKLNGDHHGRCQGEVMKPLDTVNFVSVN